MTGSLESQVPSYLSHPTLSTGSESLNASNTSSSHLPTKFSQLPNLRTFITSSPFNVLAVLALHTLSFLCNVHVFPVSSLYSFWQLKPHFANTLKCLALIGRLPNRALPDSLIQRTTAPTPPHGNPISLASPGPPSTLGRLSCNWAKQLFILEILLPFDQATALCSTACSDAIST